MALPRSVKHWSLAFSEGALILGPDGKFVKRSSSTERRAHMVVTRLDISALRTKRQNGLFAVRRVDSYVQALRQKTPPPDPRRAG